MDKAQQIAKVAIAQGGYAWLTELSLPGYEVECLGSMIQEIGLHDPFVYQLYADYSGSFSGYPADWSIIRNDDTKLVLEFVLNDYEGKRLVVNKGSQRLSLWVKHPDHGVDSDSDWKVTEQKEAH